MNIKKASKLCGVTEQMIRYYEKLGIVKPGRNKDNNYRDYKESDINNIVMAKQYSQMGIPLKTIALMIEEGSTSHALQEINVAVKQLELDVALANARLSTALNFQHLIKMMDDNISYCVGLCPLSYFYPRHGDDTQVLFDSIYNSSGAFKTVFRIPYQDLTNASYKHIQGMHSTKKLEDDHLEVIEIPTHKYWQTIIKTSNKQIINYEQLKPYLALMNQQGYQLQGDIFLYQIAYSKKEEDYIYICMECNIGL